MALIDFDKFLASFITEMRECSQMRTFSIPRCIKKALIVQGLEYKDGEIVKTQCKVSSEAKEAGYGESEDEKPVSEELKDAANNYGVNVRKGYPRVMDETDRYIYNAFKAGAEWQKNQIMSNAIDAHCFGFQGDALFSFRLPADNYLVGSEVKVIVIKKK